ncbi:MAG: hypothetical protein K1X74_05290 [Pirellulales bacterium]|nr:hypothetical protein [Pirellulales bacterium]
MHKAPSIAALLGGILVLVSSLGHSLAGGPEILGQLAASKVDPELIAGIAAGWHFGGVCLAAFGLIVITASIAQLRGRQQSPAPFIIVGLALGLFGAGAFVYRNYQPFFLGFIVAGLICALGAFGRRSTVDS